MQSTIKESLILNLKNIPGWYTKRKIIVIECDDWGSIRMPSKDVYNILISAGLKVHTKWYNRYETIESREDLEHLFNILASVRDNNRSSAVMTAVTSMANPDFKRIASCGFMEYHYEKFTETLKAYYPTANVFQLWREE